jgi:hypothetical protein
MTLKLKLVESTSAIQGKINKAIIEELNKLVTKKQKRVLNRIKAKVNDWVQLSPEIISLQSEGEVGSLNAEFGLDPGQGDRSAVDIANAVKNSIELEIKPFDERFRGEIIFYIQPSTFENLLGLPSGFTFRDSGKLDWMNWLLLLGTKTIVYGYSYIPGLEGVSGGGIMERGGVWRVPVQYSGTANNNFITRALSGREKEIQAIMQDLFT